MKNYLVKIFILVFGIGLLMPTFVLAEDGEEKEKKSPVLVYEFYGETCPHCAALNEWFDSIEEEYGDYFDLVKYETYNSKANNTLMGLVADHFGEEANGVPYIVVGEHTMSGFSEESADELLGYIMEEYEKEESERSDVVAYVIAESGWKPDDKSFDLIVGIVGVVIFVGLVFIVIKARQD